MAWPTQQFDLPQCHVETGKNWELGWPSAPPPVPVANLQSLSVIQPKVRRWYCLPSKVARQVGLGPKETVSGPEFLSDIQLTTSVRRSQWAYNWR